MNYYPGRLHQILRCDSLDVHLDLVFASKDVALIRAAITNDRSRSRRLQLGWSGDVMIDDLSIASHSRGISVTLPTDSTTVTLTLGDRLETGTGIILATPDGRRRYDNTFETRLARMEDGLRTAVYHILMEDTLSTENEQ